MTISSRWQQARNNQNKKPETITLPSKAHMYHKFLTETTLSDSWNTLSCGPNSMLANKSELIYTPTMQKSLMKRCKIKEKKLQPLLTNLRVQQLVASEQTSYLAASTSGYALPSLSISTSGVLMEYWDSTGRTDNRTCQHRDAPVII